MMAETVTAPTRVKANSVNRAPVNEPKNFGVPLCQDRCRLIFEDKAGGDDRGEMKRVRYAPERRQWAIAQMKPPHNRTVVELARETGITEVTLRT